MKRDNHDAGDPLEPGNPLKNGNFDKFWFQVLVIMLVLVILISIWFFFFAKRHHPSVTGQVSARVENCFAPERRKFAGPRVDRSRPAPEGTQRFGRRA